MVVRQASQLTVLGLGLALVVLFPQEVRADWHGGWHGGFHGSRFGVFIGGWPGYGFYPPYYYPPPYYPYPYVPAVYPPPPPPPPAYGPAPAVAPGPLASQGRNFRVFFEFDKSTLSREAERVVRE